MRSSCNARCKRHPEQSCASVETVSWIPPHLSNILNYIRVTDAFVTNVLKPASQQHTNLSTWFVLHEAWCCYVPVFTDTLAHLQFQLVSNAAKVRFTRIHMSNVCIPARRATHANEASALQQCEQHVSSLDRKGNGDGDRTHGSSSAKAAHAFADSLKFSPMFNAQM